MKRYILLSAVYTLILALLIFYKPGLIPGLYPELPQPQIVVTTFWPQAGAAEIDRRITEPLLAALSRISGLEQSRSRSTCGRSRIHLTFSAACSTTAAVHRVQTATAREAVRLPDDAHCPQVRSRGLEDVPVFAVAVPIDCAANAQRLREALSALEEVSLAHTVESTETVPLQLNYNFPAGQLQGISSVQAATQLQDESFTGTTGAITLCPDAEIPGPQLQRVLSHQTQPHTRAHSIHRLNGLRQHIFTCYAPAHSSHIRVCRRLIDLCAGFPDARVIFNRGKELERLLRATALSVLCGIGAVFLLLLIQLKELSKETVVLLTALPLILCSAVAAAGLCGIRMNIMSLAALAVGSGLVVDAAVLFYEENCRMGAPAAVVAVRPPVLMSNLTTLAIFIPVLLLPLSIRHNLQGFMIVLATVLATGTLWTLVLFPPLCRPARARIQLAVAFHLRYRRITKLVGPLFGKMSLCLLVYVTLCGLPLFWLNRLQFRPFPRIQHRTLHFRIEFPAGTDAGYIDTLMQPYFMQVQNCPLLSSVSAACSSGQASFSLTSASSRDTELVRHAVRQIPLPPGTHLIENENGGSQPGFQVRLYGRETAQLRSTITRIAAHIQAEQPGYQLYFHFKAAAPRFKVCFDTSRCGLYRIPPAEAARQVHRILTAAPAAKVGVVDQRDLLLRPGPQPADFADFFHSFRVLKEQHGIPLTALGNLTQEAGKEDIVRINRALCSGFTVLPGRTTISAAIHTVARLLNGFPLPAGYSVEVAPSVTKERLQFRWVLAAIGLAVTLLPLLLYSYYGRVKPTIFVLSFIPPALALPLPVLVLLKVPLSLPVLTGFLVNVGLSVNNALVLLSEKPQQPLAVVDLVRQLCLKLPSLTASTVTTASGVIPLLIGSGGSRGILAGLSVVIAVGAVSSWGMLFLGTIALSNFRLASD
jgi:hydrophobic/amphiphilic exporter-1 (mainly G- bacteria), HAE1 family